MMLLKSSRFAHRFRIAGGVPRRLMFEIALREMVLEGIGRSRSELKVSDEMGR